MKCVTFVVCSIKGMLVAQRFESKRASERWRQIVCDGVSTEIEIYE